MKPLNLCTLFFPHYINKKCRFNCDNKCEKKDGKEKKEQAVVALGGGCNSFSCCLSLFFLRQTQQH